MALKLNKTHLEILAGIAASTVTHVGNTKEVQELVKEGLIEVNPEMLDENKNAAVRLTDAGKAAAPASETKADEKPEVSFVIAANVEMPTIKRGGGGGKRESKYPLKDIPLGGAIFIVAPEGKKASAMSKQFGSLVSAFNKDNPDKFLTTRTMDDGAQFGPNFAGKSGVGIFHRPVSERPAPKAESAAE